jgi:hypothetical protein
MGQQPRNLGQAQCQRDGVFLDWPRKEMAKQPKWAGLRAEYASDVT